MRAVVAESSFPSYRAAARCTVSALAFLMSWVVSAGLDPVAALPGLAGRPLLVVHGTADRITPLELGRELFAGAAEPKRLYLSDGREIDIPRPGTIAIGRRTSAIVVDGMIHTIANLHITRVEPLMKAAS